MNKKRKRPNHLIIKDMIESGHSFVFCLKNFKRSPKVPPDSIRLYIDDFDIIYDVDIGYGDYTIYGHCDEYDSFATNKTTLTPFDLETGRIIVGFDKETGRILLEGNIDKPTVRMATLSIPHDNC